MAEPTDWTDAAPAAASAPPVQAKGAEPGDWSNVQVPHTDVAENPDMPNGVHIAPKDLIAGISDHMKAGHSADDIRNYVIQNGYLIPPATDRFLRDEYKPGQATPFGVDRSNEKKPTAPDAPAEEPGITVTGKPEQISAGESMWRGLRHNALGHYDDELAAASGAVGNKIGSALGLNKSNASYDEIYNHLIEQERQRTDQAYYQHEGAYDIGALGGMALMPTKGLTLGRDASMAMRAGDAAIRGAGAGAVVGSGDAQGGLADRVEGGVKGAAVGAVLAPVVGAGTAYVARGVGAAARRLGVVPGASAETSGLAALDANAPQDVEAMAGRASDMRDAGVTPRLADVVDARGRRVIKTAGGKLDAANAAEAGADAHYSDFQGNIAKQAEKLGPVSSSSVAKTARGLVQATADEQQALGPSFRAVADRPVPLTPAITDVLGTPAGLRSLKTAADMMPNVADRAQVNSLIKFLKSPPYEDPVESGMVLLAKGGKQDISGFPKPVRQKIVDQLRAAGQIAEAPTPPTLTVDVADKFARAMNSPMSRQGGLANVAAQFGKTVRGAAREAVPEYDQALTQYEGVSKVGDAAGGTGRAYEGTGFLTSPHDVHGPAVAGANPVGPVVDHLGEGQVQLPSEADALRMRAQQDVTDKATAGNRSALGVADQVSKGQAQQIRNEQMLGPTGAADLQAGMGMEAQKLRNTQQIDPRIGSQTHTMGEDDAAVAGLSHALTAASHGNVIGASIRIAGSWLKRSGIRGIDASRLVRDAVSEDPAKLDQSIAFLRSRGVPPTTAGKIMEVIKNNYVGAAGKVTGVAAGVANGSEDPVQAPNSVRMLTTAQR